jgi:hypothetical protein
MNIPIIDRAETRENRVLRAMEAAAAQAWREVSSTAQPTTCAGYLHAHAAPVGSNVITYWCPTCDCKE